MLKSECATLQLPAQGLLRILSLWRFYIKVMGRDIMADEILWSPLASAPLVSPRKL